MGPTAERMFGPVILVALLATLLLGTAAQLTQGVEVHGAGASFPAPLYARWIALFGREVDVAVRYEAVGSGAGIAAITDREVAFGASDALLSAAERDALDGPVLEVPMVMGPVVIAHNLPGLDRRLVLDGPTVGAIYRGEVDRWDDPALAALNPDLDLPDLPVRVVRRSDSSGTTSIFTTWLSAVDPVWAREVGAGKEVDWPVSAGSGDGNDEVAQQVLVRPGGIAYLELAYAENTGLAYAAMVNQAGEVVLPTTEAVQAAAASSPAGSDGVPVDIVDAPDPAAYPIAGLTYVLVHADLGDLAEEEGVETAEALLDYLRWCLTDGQDVAAELGYAPLDPGLQDHALALVDSITIE